MLCATFSTPLPRACPAPLPSSDAHATPSPRSPAFHPPSVRSPAPPTFACISVHTMSVQDFGPYLDDDDIAAILEYDNCRVEAEPPPSLPVEQNQECPICFCDIPAEERFIPAQCDHAVCKGCMTAYLVAVAKETKRYPISCPCCSVQVEYDRCLALVAPQEDVHEALQNLILEKRYIDCIRYCANPQCSAPFDFVSSPFVVGRIDEFKVHCPLCKQHTCVKCKVPWHADTPCSEQTTDAVQSGVSVLAKKKKWQACPKCANVIDRPKSDCYFVNCTCGCSFCHNCGLAYKSVLPTSSNCHGTPACSCGLFTPEVLERIRQPPQPRAMGAPPAQQQNAAARNNGNDYQNACVEACCATQ